MGSDGRDLLVRLGHNGIKNFGRDWFKATPRPPSLLNRLDEVHSIFAADEITHCAAGFFRGARKLHRVRCWIDSEGCHWMPARRREDGAGSKQARPFQGTVPELSARFHDPAVLVPEVSNGGDAVLRKARRVSGKERTKSKTSFGIMRMSGSSQAL